MALWPFSRDYYESALARLPGDLAAILAAGVLDLNLRALARELVILVPIAGARAGACRRA